MPATRKKRKVRRPVAWGNWLWVAFFACTAVGLAASPLTAIRVVRVSGAAAADRGRLTTLLQSLDGKAAAQVNPRGIETLAMAGPSVDNADFSRNIFGRGRLEVRRRMPVAIVANRRGTLLDGTGQMFPGIPPEGMPRVFLSANTLNLQATLSAAWESGRIAELCGDLRQLPLRNVTLDVAADGLMKLRLADGAVVVLGSTHQMKEKLTKLTSLIQQRPGLLDTVAEVNLTLPERPTYTPRSNP
ncbi:MAG: hypothetical protein HONBIEJF_00647 [Fimbriimonadaceae bacterium]|nr:hypothetical protein [Fimbriimonadaceae bacterium]